MRTRFTRHALERIRTRISLTAEEVVEILDRDLCILLGQDGNKSHKLFFSVPDEFCYVAIQDDINSEVITVLPVDYHNRWRVSPEIVFKAKALATGEKRADLPVSLGERGDRSLASACRFTAQLLTQDGNIRFVNLGTLPAEAYTTQPGSIEDLKVFELLKSRIEEQILSGERLHVLMVRFSRKGTPIPMYTPVFP